VQFRLDKDMTGEGHNPGVRVKQMPKRGETLDQLVCGLDLLKIGEDQNTGPASVQFKP
jgi:hypothetical protein